MGRHVHQVFKGAQRQHYSAGQLLYQSGSEPDLVYYVVTGQFTLLRERGGKLHRVGEKPEGSLIGETAALDGGPRTVTVEASDEASVLVLPVEVFRQRLQDDAQACYEVAVSIAQVLRESART